MSELISFNEERHVYTEISSGLAVPSVTTIISSGLSLDYSRIDPWYAEFGTAVHKAVELFVIGTLDEETMMPEIEPYLLGFKKFLAETGFKAVETEQILFNKELFVAGTADLFGTLSGKPAIVDIKSGVKQKWHGVQTAAYACMRDEDAEMLRFCLYLNKNSGYKLEGYKDPRDLSFFKSLVTVHHGKKRYL
jgi:hypothetical protein